MVLKETLAIWVQPVPKETPEQPERKDSKVLLGPLATKGLLEAQVKPERKESKETRVLRVLKGAPVPKVTLAIKVTLATRE